jgi:hypothetical protein
MDTIKDNSDPYLIKNKQTITSTHLYDNVTISEMHTYINDSVPKNYIYTRIQLDQR